MKQNHMHSYRAVKGECDTCDEIIESLEAANRPYVNEFEQWIHENIMGECWHVMEFDAVLNSDVCSKCGKQIHYVWGGSRATINSHYKYTTSLDAIRKVEEKVFEKAGRIQYRKYLMDVVAEDLAKEFHGRHPAGLIVEEATFATAEQRAKACRTAWELAG